MLCISRIVQKIAKFQSMPVIFSTSATPSDSYHTSATHCCYRVYIYIVTHLYYTLVLQCLMGKHSGSMGKELGNDLACDKNKTT